MNECRHLVLALAVFAVLAAAGSQAQETVVLRYQMAEDTVRAMDIVVTQSGSSMGQPQSIDATLTMVSRARNVSEEGFTEDLYTVDGWMRIETAGVVLDTSEEGSELRGAGVAGDETVVTQRVDWYGRPLESADVPSSGDVASVLTKALQASVGHLPVHAVAPGDTWSEQGSAQVGHGAAEVTVDWRLDRVVEIDGRRYAILLADARAVCENVDAGRKEQRVPVQGTVLHQYIDEFVEYLSVAEAIEMQWDIEAGYSPVTTVDQVLQADSLSTVTDADTGQVQVADFAVHVERTGKVSVTTRPPTDDELARMAPQALAGSIARRDLALLESLLAPGFDATDLEGSLQSYFAAYDALEASVSDVKVNLEADRGTASFVLAVSGAKAQVGPGADMSELEPLYKGPVTLSLARSGSLWRIDGGSIGGT